MEKETQEHKILRLLGYTDFVCTSMFYANYISDPRTIICRLKKKGYKLESRQCRNEYHNHEGNSKEWHLIKEQKTLFN